MGNLFNPDYVSGNLSEIQVVVNILGQFSVWVISLVGFGITIFTILKNAMHGLYAVSPKFWDKVSDAKQASNLMEAGGGGNKISKSLGFISITILACLPNVKAMTDFEDGNLDPKAYFLKSIPLACVQIFIGVFIFFGYPARVAEKFSDFGKGLFDVVLLNVDPGYWVKSLPQKFAVLNFSTDGSKNDFDVGVNMASRSTTNAIIGELSDMEKERRVGVALEVEQWIISQLTPFSEYTNKDKYEMVVKSRIEIAQPNISLVHDKHDKGVHSFAFIKPVDEFSHGSAKESAGLWLRVDVTVQETSQKGVMGSVNVSMEHNIAWREQSGTYTLDLGGTFNAGARLESNSNGNATCMVDKVKCSIEVVPNTNTIKIKPQGNQKLDLAANAVTSVSGVKYAHGTTSYGIDSITKTSVAKVTFRPTDSKYGDVSWVFGDGAPKDGVAAGGAAGDTSSNTTSSNTGSSEETSKDEGFGD